MKKPIALIVLVAVLSHSGLSAQTDGSVRPTATIVNISGGSSDHDVVVWVTTSSDHLIGDLHQDPVETGGDYF